MLVQSLRSTLRCLIKLCFSIRFYSLIQGRTQIFQLNAKVYHARARRILASRKNQVLVRVLYLPEEDYWRDAHYSIVLLVFDFTIQYIGIVRRTNTIYWYCPTHRYNILVLSDRPMQHIGLVQQTKTIYCTSPTSEFDLKGFQHTA